MLFRFRIGERTGRLVHRGARRSVKRIVSPMELLAVIEPLVFHVAEQFLFERLEQAQRSKTVPATRQHVYF